jgi:hypothetical protein
MIFPRAIDRRVAAVAIFAGFVAVALVAKNVAITSPATDPLPVLSSSPLAQAAADVPTATPVSDGRVATASNACETQNWPYYSKECLRGEASAPAPRQVHLQPASTAPTLPEPVTVAMADASARQASEARKINETPRHRKARPTQSFANRPVVRRVRQMQQPEPDGFGRALAYSW